MPSHIKRAYFKPGSLWPFRHSLLLIFLLANATETWAVIAPCRKCGEDYERKYDPAAGEYKNVHVNNHCSDAPGSSETTHEGAQAAGYFGIPSNLKQCHKHNIEFPDCCPMCDSSACAPAEPMVRVFPDGPSGSGTNSLVTPVIHSPRPPSGNYQNQALTLAVFMLAETVVNFIYSPHSLIQLLYQLSTAASGDTRTLLNDFASRPVVDQGTSDALRISNIAFHSDRYLVNQQWRENQPENARTEAVQVDFSSPQACIEAARNANDRIAESTNGRMTGVIDSRSWHSATVLILCNICYFSAKWREQLRQTELYFGVPERDHSVLVNGIEGNDITGGYYESQDGWTAVSLPYRDEVEGERGFEMVFILPPAGTLPNAATEESLRQILSSLEPGRTINYFTVPAVTLNSQFGLSESLCHINLQKLIYGQLDLSTMLTPREPTRPITLNSIEQKCFLKMDHQGTEACAVTEIECVDGAWAPPRLSFQANRPYIVVLRSVRDQTILFFGAVYDPRSME